MTIALKNSRILLTTMRRFNLDPADPQSALDKLTAEREIILARVENPIARLAVRISGTFGYGTLAENTWQINHTRKKLPKD